MRHQLEVPSTKWLGALLLGAVVCAQACGERLQQVAPQLVPPELSQDFGEVPVLNEKKLELPITNAGRAALKVESATLTAGDGPFVVRAVPTEVGAGETVPMTVAFVPLKEQKYDGTLHLSTNDPEQPELDIALTGQGSTRAVMELSPAMLDFGRVGECSSQVLTFTITSKGTADLIVTDIAFTEGTSPAFTFVGSTRTPATVKYQDKNGLPGTITLTVKVSFAQGASEVATGGIRVRNTDPDQQEVVIPLTAAPNRAPVPVITPLGNGAPGAIVGLNGSGSNDPDNDAPLSYKWSLRQKPLSSSTTIEAPDMASTRMVLDPDLPGAYEVQLDVTDATGIKSCSPARSTIVAMPAQKLLVEMFWDNAKTDLDLHVLRTVSSPVGMAPDDCYYANRTPDWGAPGPNDDPKLVRDALTGYGPELWGYVNPVDSTYRVVVEFANEHLDPNPESNVTVRVYVLGEVKFEATRQLSTKGARWPVVDVTWPSGEVKAVP